ncbi:WRKY transcription factor SUSIBA2 isoform X2 [Dendrobium catenatum]|uniref:Putative WRKY transcription factor 20 n=1 Tax=Dendrobium catenatum TaxID=906689 RepID=A0A2I0XGQ7_9ASPA|nr:WRKY transcription factor SUSIBA2 isoform X2 [Dendrobium catenatum]PKU87097.1 putative WRKY transcription factor 20 [Dendrobium catenatum]
MSEMSISGAGDHVASSIPPEISTTSAGARYKMMSPGRLPITRSPCLTIPPGFSPGALLESPVLLTNMKAEPSPTTGTFAMPLILNNGGLAALGSPKDSSKGCVSEDGSSPYFEFRPHIRLSSRPGLSSLAPLGSLGLNSKQQEFVEKNQCLCDTNGSSSSQVVKTECIAQSSPESTWSATASGSPVEVFTLKANGFCEDASNELQLTKDLDCRIQASQSDQNGSNPLNAVEKSSEDGYNWRKYGQKHVKGSEFPRSYYKCTHPNCQMKKQLERSHDGHITEIIYKGRHDHPKPQASRRSAVGGVSTGQEEEKEDGLSCFANFEEKFSNAHCHSSHVNPNCNSELSPVSVSDDEVEVGGGQSGLGGDDAADDDPESKRRKMEVATIDANSIAKNNREPRVVVQTVSEVDILDDGYRWRKYGQKVVKGNPNPRSYYKCTNPGCSVRKHVERASHDPKAVITTYEGKHNHDVPAAKTTNNNNRESSPPLITDANIPRTYITHQYSQPEENNAINLHLGVGVGSNHNNLLNEKQHLSGLERIPSHHHHHHHHQYISSDCNNVMIQLNPVSKLYGSSNNVVFGSRDNKGEGFSFSTQMNNSSSHYYPRADNLVMGP